MAFFLIIVAIINLNLGAYALSSVLADDDAVSTDSKTSSSTVSKAAKNLEQFIAYALHVYAMLFFQNNVVPKRVNDDRYWHKLFCSPVGQRAPPYSFA